jgi:heat shock protein HslJ
MKWILILLVVCSCATAKTKQSAPQVSIHDIYVLVAVQGKIIEEEMKNQSTLEINLTEMQMIGNDGCNNFSGKITQHNPDKQELRFGDIVATEMYCDEISNKVGQSFYAVKKFQRKGLSLMLFSEDGKELLRYKKVD